MKIRRAATIPLFVACLAHAEPDCSGSINMDITECDPIGGDQWLVVAHKSDTPSGGLLDIEAGCPELIT